MARRTDSERQAAALPVAAQFDSLPDDAYLGVRHVAALLNCSTSTVWRASTAGRIPAPLNITDGVVRWRVGTLRRALRSRSKEAA
jgi:predicted DNA-binding transcriptional regulator AlpA